MLTSFERVMQSVWQVEHNGDIRKILHFNKQEKTYTFYGIYPYAKLKSWRKIKEQVLKRKTLSQASIILSQDKDLYQEVLDFYWNKFWIPMKLDYIDSIIKQAEVMIFVVNVGIGRKKDINKAIQRMVGTKPDGIMGPITIEALNNFEDFKFDKLFDTFEINWYAKLIERVPRLEWARKGWIRRAKYV